MGERLSARAYANRRGCSHSAVNKAIAAGRLRGALSVDHRGKTWIDPAIADREWSENTNPVQQREQSSRAGGVPPGTVPPNQGQPKSESQPGLFESDDPPQAAAGQRSPSLARVQAHRIAYQAALARLEYEERSGKLVVADEVRAEAFRVARAVRDKMRMIPVRVGPILAAETDPQSCIELLAKEIELALEDLHATTQAHGQ